jgi:hypothetical protein
MSKRERLLSKGSKTGKSKSKLHYIGKGKGKGAIVHPGEGKERVEWASATTSLIVTTILSVKRNPRPLQTHVFAPVPMKPTGIVVTVIYPRLCE